MRRLLTDEETEKTDEFYTTEAGTQKKYEEKLCQSAKKKIKKNEYGTIDSI